MDRFKFAGGLDWSTFSDIYIPLWIDLNVRKNFILNTLNIDLHSTMDRFKWLLLVYKNT